MRELNHINWELVTAFDMGALGRDVADITREGSGNKAVVPVPPGERERAKMVAEAKAAKDMEELKAVLAHYQVRLRTYYYY